MPTLVGESKTLKSTLKILMLMLTEHYGAYKKKSTFNGNGRKILKFKPVVSISQILFNKTYGVKKYGITCK